MNEQIEINKKTLNVLADAVFYAGFGAITKDQLSAALAKGTDEFQVVHDTKMNGDSVRGVLHFKRSDQDLNNVFFNSFDLLLKKEGKEETLQRNFPVYYGNKYTLKEGYNLLDGRSVQKEFTKIDPDNKDIKNVSTPWVYLDFKNVDDKGNLQIEKKYEYDLEKELEKYPIKGMEFSRNKKQLMDALKKGDRVEITMKTSDGEKEIRIEAAPRVDSINLYDKNNKPIRLSIKDNDQSQSQGQEVSNKTNQTQNEQNSMANKTERKAEAKQTEQPETRKRGSRIKA
ncbi:hypothetical protein [Sphingobacterium siyangense]|uniref:hypothetical protein n=1 Tax=Sphingobacterium siyangense TaxID=459529 RepID=UPI002FD90AF5